MMQNYLKSTRNPNLKLGDVKDMHNAFEADVMTKDNSLVDKVQVDKNTARMRSIYNQQQQQVQRPLDRNDAKTMMQNYLNSTRNPNLKLGDVKDTQNAFEADIMTKDNSLVDRVQVDKNTGWMHSAY
jgi:hypothetical protein